MTLRRPLLVLAAMTTMSLVTPACSQDVPETETETSRSGETVYKVTDEDPEMNRAIQQARLSLPQFWDKFEAKPAGYSGFTIKAAMPVVSGSGREHIWVNVISRKDGKIQGRLANEPLYLGDLRLGSEVAITPDIVSDWGYVKDRRLYGHYTTRVLLARENPDAKPADIGLAATPLEVGIN